MQRLRIRKPLGGWGSGRRGRRRPAAPASDATGTAGGRDMGPGPQFKIGPYYQRAGPLEFPVGLATEWQHGPGVFGPTALAVASPAALAGQVRVRSGQVITRAYLAEI
jgi:hypothetical protein